MSNLQVDNDELHGLADDMERLFNDFKKDITFLRDDNADLFKRFMSYNSLRNVMSGIEFVLKMTHKSWMTGHCLQDPIFHTKAGIDSGWSESKYERHPFFINK